MLADFQQALADLVADAGRCQALREGDERHLDAYELTPTERTRLVAIACHRGMAASCAMYRSNRLTPIVVNLPDTCAALGEHLRTVIDGFWASHPAPHFVHSLMEGDRFATYVVGLPAGTLPGDVATAVAEAVEREGPAVRAGLAATS